MDPGLLALLLLAVGLGVMAIEVFVPSGGLLALMSMAAFAGSVFFAAYAWWGTNMVAFWAYAVSLVVLIPATLVGAFYMLPRTEFGRRLLQEPPTAEESASFTEERAALAATVGRRGVAVTLHNPGGLVEVDGVRHHSESRGLMLDPGEPVEVVGTRGHRLLVRRADAPVPVALEPSPAELSQPERVAAPTPAAADTPTVIAPAADRPGGRIDEDAPVGYAEPAAVADGDRDDTGGAVDDPFAEDAEREAGAAGRVP